MRTPRLTTRRMMAIVAVAALALAVYAGIERRRAHLRTLARHHWEMLAVNSVAQQDANRKIIAYRASASPEKRRLAHYHATLAIKYDQAARYPWLPVAPDPPEPE